jgi:hypothetical protein
MINAYFHDASLVFSDIEGRRDPVTVVGAVDCHRRDAGL